MKFSPVSWRRGGTSWGRRAPTRGAGVLFARPPPGTPETRAPARRWPPPRLTRSSARPWSRAPRTRRRQRTHTRTSPRGKWWSCRGTRCCGTCWSSRAQAECRPPPTLNRIPEWLHHSTPMHTAASNVAACLGCESEFCLTTVFAWVCLVDHSWPMKTFAYQFEYFVIE